MTMYVETVNLNEVTLLTEEEMKGIKAGTYDGWGNCGNYSEGNSCGGVCAKAQEWYIQTQTSGYIEGIWVNADGYVPCIPTWVSNDYECKCPDLSGIWWVFYP